jgi:hypothetical protein
MTNNHLQIYSYTYTVHPRDTYTHTLHIPYTFMNIYTHSWALMDYSVTSSTDARLSVINYRKTNDAGLNFLSAFRHPWCLSISMSMMYVHVHALFQCCTSMFLSMFMPHIYMCLYLYLCLYTYCTYICTHIHTYIQTYIHTYIHTYTQTDRQKDIHTSIPTYIYTYVFTYIDVCVCACAELTLWMWEPVLALVSSMPIPSYACTYICVCMWTMILA